MWTFHLPTKIAPEIVASLIQESFLPVMKNNPKEVTVEDLQNIYAELNH